MNSKNTLTQLWGNPRLSPKESFKFLYENTPSETTIDFYGYGESIENFESEFSDFLGKDACLFMPSGTMAQQIALRVWCDKLNKKKVYFHPLSHLEIHEQDAIYHLHPHLQTKTIGDKKHLLSLSDLKKKGVKDCVLLLELPQRELGGILPSWNELVETSTWCKSQNITLHLDGARIWECTPYYQKSVNEICKLFDSVYISFYKGLGGIAGAILTGEASFIKDCKIWQRRYGGNLISLYPYYLNAKLSFEQRFKKMDTFHERAKNIAAILNTFEHVETSPHIPQTNMFHIKIKMQSNELNHKLLQIEKEMGVKVLPLSKNTNTTEIVIEFSVGDNTLRFTNIEIKELLKRVLSI